MRSQSRDACNSNLPIREGKRRIHVTRNDEDSVLQHNLHLMAVFSFKQHYVSLGQWILHSVVMNWSSQMNVFNKEHTANRLFIDPLLVVLGVLNESLREPELDLTLSRLDGVRSVDHVVSHIATEVSTNGAGGRLQRLGGSHHLTGNGDDVVSLPHHGDHGGRAHESSQAGVEGLALVLSVVLLQERHGRNQHLQTDQLETLLLEASNDLTNMSALDTIGLNGKESSFLYNYHRIEQPTRGIG